MENTAVIILNWNGLNLLKQFLPSVVQSSDLAQIYIADNASTDESVAWVKLNYPDVKIIQLKKNFGYAEGYNQALKQVPEEYCILLNNDVKVEKGWTKAITKLLQLDLKVAAVQPKIRDYNKPEYFEYAGAAGGLIDYFAYPYCRGRVFDKIEKDLGQYEKETEIFWASGACLGVKKSVFFEVGGFDTDYFAHMEEIDLCWRMKNKGYKVYYTPFSKIFHLGGGTLSNSSPQKTFLNFRNSLYNLLKNAPSRAIIAKILLRLIIDGFAALYFLFQLKPTHLWAILRAHFSFYKNFYKIRRKRNIPPISNKYYTATSIIFKKIGHIKS